MVDKGCPIVLGGPLPHVMAAKAIAFKEANSPAFQRYAQQVVKNAQALAQQLTSKGVKVTTGGTDNHLLVFDVHTSFGLTGRQAELALREAHFTVNRNAVPFDTQGPWYTSGIRIGSPALTTLGMKEAEMHEIAGLIVTLLKATKPAPAEKGEGMSRAKTVIDPHQLSNVRGQVKGLLSRFPLYPELVIE